MADTSPTPISSNSSAQIRQQYLQTKNNSNNIAQILESQNKEERSGLKGIEVRSRAPNLGKDDFLQLLVTQLSYQDPTSPIKDQQFIAQMAQFSSLEQMQNMTSALKKLSARQASHLIGKEVQGLDFVSGESVSGTVQSVFYDQQGSAFLKVRGRSIALSQLESIGPGVQPLGATQSRASTVERVPLNTTPQQPRASTLERAPFNTTQARAVNTLDRAPLDAATTPRHSRASALEQVSAGIATQANKALWKAPAGAEMTGPRTGTWIKDAENTQNIRNMQNTREPRAMGTETSPKNGYSERAQGQPVHGTQNTRVPQ